MIINNFTNYYQNIKFTSKITTEEVIDKETVPYFKTPEGQMAVALNKQALSDIKTNINFLPKPVEECDRKIIESDRLEDCRRWTNWVDPKSGKFYTIIKKRDNINGTKTVRVLDDSGKLIKECNIRPKKIVVIDEEGFTNDDTQHTMSNNLIGHGFLVSLIAKRTNPIANVETMIINKDTKDITEENLIAALKKVLKRLKRGEKIDAINISLGSLLSLDREFCKTQDSYTIQRTLDKIAKNDKDKKNAQEYTKLKELLDKIGRYGTRILISAGNSGDLSYNIFCTGRYTEPVAGLGNDGRVSENSSSRRLAIHYEAYSHPIIFKKGGLEIEGYKGAEIPYPKHYAKIAGKSADGNVVTKEKLEEINESTNPEDMIYKEKLKDGLLLIENEPVTIKGVQYPVYSNVADEESMIDEFYLGATKDGFLIPLSYYKNPPLEISGTSIAAPKRAAKLMLNDAMQEILHQKD